MASIPVEKIIRSRRRTIALEITHDATLIVRAPLRTSRSRIDELVAQKRDWIQKKMVEVKSRPVVPERKFINGELFLFLGRQYQLEMCGDGTTGCAGIVLRDKLYVPCSLTPGIRDHLICWYAQEAGKYIQSRCTWFSMTTGYQPASVKISGARRRFGSCSTKGRVNFSWRLILAPAEVVDYVIVHELVHIKQPDHSKEFWNKVGRIIPDYREHRQWLRQHAAILAI
jgi:predicted metal-dependent hydrolase